ncbi:MAG: MOP flippase family protein, partial [Chlorobiales bacterium]|nr:MOP flippase family protein [Chlorobiales bacterium]
VALSILLALNGWGVFSIIWGQLCDTTLRAILFLWKGSRLWRPKFYFNRQELKGFLSFGFYQMGERSINYLTSNIDQILVGSLLGATSLGYYSLACNLVYQPFMRLNPILTKVAYPVFSKLQASKEKLAQGYLMLVWLLSLINFPLLFGIAGVATVLIPTVFGDKWLPVVEIIQVLSLVGVLKSVMNPVGTLLLSRGRADLGFNWNIYTGTALVAGVFLGIKLGGLFGVTIAILVLYSSFFVFSFIFLIKPQTDIRFKDYLMTIVPSLAISVVMAVVVKYLPALFLSPSISMLVVQVVLGLGIFALLNYLFQREKMVEMRNMALNRG